MKQEKQHFRLGDSELKTLSSVLCSVPDHFKIQRDDQFVIWKLIFIDVILLTKAKIMYVCVYMYIHKVSA